VIMVGPKLADKSALLVKQNQIKEKWKQIIDNQGPKHLPPDYSARNIRMAKVAVPLYLELKAAGKDAIAASQALSKIIPEIYSAHDPLKAQAIIDQAKLDPIVKNYLNTFTEFSIIRHLNSFLEEFNEIVAIEKKEVVVRLTTAYEWSNAEFEEIESTISKKVPSGYTLVLKIKVDPNIEQGYILAVPGEEVQDKSLASIKLRIQKKLFNAISHKVDDANERLLEPLADLKEIFAGFEALIPSVTLPNVGHQVFYRENPQVAAHLAAK